MQSSSQTPMVADNTDTTELHNAILEKSESKELDKKSLLYQAIKTYIDNGNFLKEEVASLISIEPMGSCTPLVLLSNVQINTLKAAFPKKYEWIFERAIGISALQITNPEGMPGGLGVILDYLEEEQRAESSKLIEVEERLYQELRNTIVLSQEKNNFNSAIDNFKKTSKYSRFGLISLTEAEFVALEEKFTEYQTVFEHYRWDNKWYNERLNKAKEKAKEELDNAKVGYKIALRMAKKSFGIENADEKKNESDSEAETESEENSKDLPLNNLNAKLKQAGRDVVNAIDTMEKNHTLKQYRFLTEILMQTRLGAKYPTDKIIKNKYFDLTKKAHDDLSISLVVGGAMTALLGILTITCGLMLLGLMPFWPAAIMPALALGIFGAVLTHKGLSIITTEVREKRSERLPAPISQKCTLFHNQMKNTKEADVKPSSTHRVFATA